MIQVAAPALCWIVLNTRPYASERQGHLHNKNLTRMLVSPGQAFSPVLQSPKQLSLCPPQPKLSCEDLGLRLWSLVSHCWCAGQFQESAGTHDTRQQALHRLMASPPSLEVVEPTRSKSDHAHSHDTRWLPTVRQPPQRVSSWRANVNSGQP